MRPTIDALIFDMDGVLINSEHLWRKAMIRGFTEFGMPITDEECRRTMGMRFKEVIRIWLDHFKISHLTVKTIETRVIDLLLELIEKEGEHIEGIPEIVAFCTNKAMPMGLATSSSEILMRSVLKKLDLESAISVKVSAEHLRYGKPHPEVFLICAEQLNVPPQHCLVIEDSLNGVIAAKAAQMIVAAVPDDEHTKLQQFALADYKFNSMFQVLELLKKAIH